MGMSRKVMAHCLRGLSSAEDSVRALGTRGSGGGGRASECEVLAVRADEGADGGADGGAEREVQLADVAVGGMGLNCASGMVMEGSDGVNAPDSGLVGAQNARQHGALESSRRTSRAEWLAWAEL